MELLLELNLSKGRGLFSPNVHCLTTKQVSCMSLVVVTSIFLPLEEPSIYDQLIRYMLILSKLSNLRKVNALRFLVMSCAFGLQLIHVRKCFRKQIYTQKREFCTKKEANILQLGINSRFKQPSLEIKLATTLSGYLGCKK